MKPSRIFSAFFVIVVAIALSPVRWVHAEDGSAGVFGAVKSYRGAGDDLLAKTLLRNAATAQEAKYAESDQYVACKNEACEDVLPGFSYQAGINLELTVSSDGKGFKGTASSIKHPGTVHRWNSASGAE